MPGSSLWMPYAPHVVKELNEDDYISNDPEDKTDRLS